jgi:hypothetical protein
MMAIKMYSPSDESEWNYWIQEWWKWLLSIPDDTNPCNDHTGQYCGINQTGKDDRKVWFLTGSHSRKCTRTCNIPSQKRILLPVANIETSFLEFGTDVESELFKLARDGNRVQDMWLTLDKDRINKSDLEKYYKETPLFDVYLPENNIWLWTDSGPTKAVSVGYWVFLEPLSTGNHTLHFYQKTADNPPTGTLRCEYDVTYNLTV